MTPNRIIDLGTLNSSKPFKADLDIILRSNVLVQANSGGGKSWTLRRMIEQTFGRVPQIIIDPEGEFSTLRQKFDLVLVGKGGDTPADLRSAQLLAHRLLELGTSAVVDLFEMSKTQRPVWVAAFVQALVDAPKKLWRDLLLYVDEAHELAPEAGHGAHESAAEKTCRHALIDFAAKGRKRGYGVVAATQRLGKLSKDFAAELKNVLVGQTFIDIDRERAAGSLGIAKADKAKFFVDVKTLKPGAFYALGRAFTLEPTLVTIGPVTTEHPEAGRRQSAPPPPTEKIRHLLPQLADLPKEAETKLQTEKELRARIVELEAKLKVETLLAPPKTAYALPPASFAVAKTLQDQVAEIRTASIEEAPRVAAAALLNARKLMGLFGRYVLHEPSRPGAALAVRPADPAPRPNHNRPVALAASASADTSISTYAMELLKVIVSRGTATDAQISTLSGYRRTSSGFGKALAELNNAGLIGGPATARYPTEAGRDLVGDVQPPPTGPALLDYWCSRLTTSEGNVLRVIYANKTVTRDEISEKTGYSQTSSGFGKAIGGLARLGLITTPRGGDISLSEAFT